MNRFGREEAIAQLIVARKALQRRTFRVCRKVLSLASASDATPSIIQPLSDITIIEGQPLKLSCNISGLQVTVNWFHNGQVNVWCTEEWLGLSLSLCLVDITNDPNQDGLSGWKFHFFSFTCTYLERGDDFVLSRFDHSSAWEAMLVVLIVWWRIALVKQEQVVVLKWSMILNLTGDRDLLVQHRERQLLPMNPIECFSHSKKYPRDTSSPCTFYKFSFGSIFLLVQCVIHILCFSLCCIVEFFSYSSFSSSSSYCRCESMKASSEN